MTVRFLAGLLLMGAAVALGLSAVRANDAHAQAGPTVQVGGNAQLGSFLVGPNGRTLYIFTNDTPGTSVCFNQCETNWPPLTVAANVTPTLGAGVTGTLGIFVRPDNSRQVTLDGRPLYYWHTDAAAGDAFGQGLGGVWFVVSAAQPGEVLRLGTSAGLGPVLTGPNGRTLYIFTNDTTSASVCYGQCAINWPPLTVPAGTTPSAAPGLNAGALGTSPRTDGPNLQVTLGGRPLYYWHLDAAAGDSKGHGIGNIWFALDAAGVRHPFTPAAATPTVAPTAVPPAAPKTGTGFGEGPGSGIGTFEVMIVLVTLGAGMLMVGTAAAARRRR